MLKNREGLVTTEHVRFVSGFLGRTVYLDFYLPQRASAASPLSLLLLNDGQDLAQMQFASMLQNMTEAGLIEPLLCVGIHAGDERMMEYGTANLPDYAGRGAMARAYTDFVLYELLPFVHSYCGVESFDTKAIAGFSLGGLSAMDIGWHHPDVFQTVGAFSGSFWWRSRSLEAGYDDDRDRIMHALVRQGTYHPGQRFYFTTGSLDETADRNNNGIIDSIDDTMALIEELKKKGANPTYDIRYINYEEGRHDVESWGKAMPQFLLWGWGKEAAKNVFES